MYTKIKNLLAPFPFKPFSTLFWDLLPFSLRVPLHILVRKGRRGKSSARTSFLTPFESNIKMGGEQHDLSFLVYFQVSICKLIFALVILHHVSFPSYPGINKVTKKKNQNKRESDIAFCGFLLIFNTSHYFDFPRGVLQCTYQALCFSCLSSLQDRENMVRFSFGIFLLGFLL